MNDEQLVPYLGSGVLLFALCSGLLRNLQS